MNKKIFELLSCSLSVKNITLLSNPTIFQQGYEYFRQNKVEAIRWHENKQLLIVLVHDDTIIHQVIIMQNRRDLDQSCTCHKYHSSDKCNHVICALLTINSIIHNQTLSTTSQNLLDGLLGKITEKSVLTATQPVTINIAPKSKLYDAFMSPAAQFACFFNNKKLTQWNFKEGSPLEKFVKDFSFPYYQDQSSSLISCISSNTNNTIHLEIQTKNGPLLVTWENRFDLLPITEINLKDDELMYVRCKIQQKDGVMLDNLIHVSNNLVVDVQTNRLLHVSNSRSYIVNDSIGTWIAGVSRNHPWKFFCNLIESVLKGLKLIFYNRDVNIGTVLPEHHAIFASDSISFPVISNPIPFMPSDINTTNPLLFEQKNTCRFRTIELKKNDVLIIPQKIVPENILNGSIDFKNNTITLEPRYLIDNANEALPVSYLLMNAIRSLDEQLKYESWLFAEERQSIVIKTLFDLISINKKTTAAELIKRVSEDLRATFNEKQSISNLKRCFKKFHDEFFDNSRCAIVIIHNNFYEIDLCYEALLEPCKMLIHFFTKIELDTRASTPRFIVPLEEFYEKFYSFNAQLEQRNIPLRFNDKRVEFVNLEVKIDVSRNISAGLFDLAPHIAANGIELTDEQREILFSHEGAIEDADCIKILDPQSRKIMILLASIFNRDDKVSEGKKKKNIVQLPRLKVLDLLELRSGGIKIVFTQEDEDLVQRLINFSKIEKISLPTYFLGELREYQKDGYYWLSFLYKYGFGACLADDMGLGKTIQVIAFLGGLKEEIIQSKNIQKTPHLIVVTPTLIFNWKQELNKFYPKLTVTVYTGKTMATHFDGCDIVLTTYDRVRLNSDTLKDIMFHTLILDEAQAIKNIFAARTAAIRQLKSQFTICLTGTPLENHVGEYHSIIDVALPGLLPEYKQFLKNLQDSENNTLIKKTKPFVLRRTKEAMLKELPPKVESNVILTMSSSQQKIYATAVTEVKRMIDQAYETKAAPQAKIIALTAILRLRQICISPEIIDTSTNHDSPKIDHLINNLEEITQEGNAALIFSQFTSCLDLLEKALTKAKLTYFRIDGKTSMNQRAKIIESFQNNHDNVCILLLSLKTGGVGLNLTRANYVFHVDPWWNPSIENQASDRSHRIGQQNTVFVSRLIMHETIEEKIMALKEKKMKLFNDIIENAENKTDGLISKKDFDLLFH